MVVNLNLKPEDQLLLYCSFTRISNEKIKDIHSLLASDLDWEYIMYMAYRHRLNYLLYWHLNRISPDKLPNNVKQKLGEDFHVNVHKNMAMFRELIQVIILLEKNGIPSIPYKGPLLAKITYGNLGLRGFGDLDFYVRLEDVPKARDILIENGYEPLMKFTPSQEKTFYKFQREYHFTNKSTGITLEIKWKFLSLYSITNEPFLDGTDFLMEVNMDHFQIKTISPEPLIFILFIHNASHLFSSLYRFCDLSELIKAEKNINWEHLLEMAREIRAWNIFMINLYILQELFEVQIPKGVLEQVNGLESVEKISNEIIKRFFQDRSMGVWEELSFHMNLRENRKDKFIVFLSMIFLPTPGVIKSISLPLILEPVYYILRVFQILKNITNN